MAGDEPTLGEIGRRLERTERDVEQIPSVYVPRGEYDEARRGDRAEVTALAKRVEGTESWRRQVSLTVAVSVIGWLVAVSIAIAGFVMR